MGKEPPPLLHMSHPTIHWSYQISFGLHERMKRSSTSGNDSPAQRRKLVSSSEVEDIKVLLESFGNIIPPGLHSTNIGTTKHGKEM